MGIFSKLFKTLGIGAIPVGMKGKLFGAAFKVLAQYDIYNKVVIEIYSLDPGSSGDIVTKIADASPATQKNAVSQLKTWVEKATSKKLDKDENRKIVALVKELSVEVRNENNKDFLGRKRKPRTKSKASPKKQGSNPEGYVHLITPDDKQFFPVSRRSLTIPKEAPMNGEYGGRYVDGFYKIYHLETGIPAFSRPSKDLAWEDFPGILEKQGKYIKDKLPEFINKYLERGVYNPGNPSMRAKRPYTPAKVYKAKKSPALATKSEPKKAVKRKVTKNPASGRSAWAIAMDKRLSAKKPGKRRSASGNTYYEYRVNRSDQNKKTML